MHARTQWRSHRLSSSPPPAETPSPPLTLAGIPLSFVQFKCILDRLPLDRAPASDCRLKKLGGRATRAEPRCRTAARVNPPLLVKILALKPSFRFVSSRLDLYADAFTRETIFHTACSTEKIEYPIRMQNPSTAILIIFKMFRWDNFWSEFKCISKIHMLQNI